MAEKRDYYETLGVKRNATKDEIKSAYRKLVRQYHPDNKETGNEAKFKEVQEAYDILYDDQKRSTYDQFGHAAFEQGGAGGPGAGNPFEGFGGAGGFGGFEDIFSSFFGGGGSQRRTRNPNAPTRGQDTMSSIKIDFIDAVRGKDIDYTITVDVSCPKCHGTGAKSPNDIRTCPHCGGRGYVTVQSRSIFGIVENQQICPHCGGTGKIVTSKCDECGGRGYVKQKKSFTLHIHPGIASGQQLRIEGYGERGTNGGPNGDLYVEVAVKPHPFFKRDGNDIHLEVPIDFIDAILGSKIDIPTVNGEVTLEIPSGTQPGQVLRMKGQGMKDYRSGKPGDQYVHLQIKNPNSLSKEQRIALENYRNASSRQESSFDKFKRTFRR